MSNAPKLQTPCFNGFDCKMQTWTCCPAKNSTWFIQDIANRKLFDIIHRHQIVVLAGSSIFIWITVVWPRWINIDYVVFLIWPHKTGHCYLTCLFQPVLLVKSKCVSMKLITISGSAVERKRTLGPCLSNMTAPILSDSNSLIPLAVFCPH